jgi:hypothetical protein
VDRYLPTVIVGVIFLLVLIGMLWGWRNRSKRHNDLTELAPVPAELGEVFAAASGLYVATTLSDEPLERVTIRGLGFRSRSTVTVTEAGIVLALTGQEPRFLAKDAIRAVHRSTWTIDKAVEPGGLVVIAWRWGERDVDSYFRLDGEPGEFIALAEKLVEVSE